MEAVQHPSSIPNKLFLSGSDLHTPVGDATYTPSSRPPVNGTSTSSVGTFAVKVWIGSNVKDMSPLIDLGLMVRRCDYGCSQVFSKDVRD